MISREVYRVGALSHWVSVLQVDNNKGGYKFEVWEQIVEGNSIEEKFHGSYNVLKRATDKAQSVTNNNHTTEV